jgi:Plant protein of unknown function
VLELFLGTTGPNGFIQLGYSHHDPTFATRKVTQALLSDMVMLENQIPLFVLERLLAIQLRRPYVHPMVCKLAISFFQPLLQSYDHDKISYAEVFDPLSDIELHPLDAFRLSLLKMNTEKAPAPPTISTYEDVRVNKGSRQLLVQRALKLQKAGIMFMRKNSDCFWHISFEDQGILHIPRILINDGTKSLFLNLIAFEQCHADAVKHVTSYVIFMRNLISTKEDVRYTHFI